MFWSRHIQFDSHVAKRTIGFIVVQSARGVHVRNKQVQSAVTVVVAPRRSFGAFFFSDTYFFSDIHKLSIPLVVVKSAAITRFE